MKTFLPAVCHAAGLQHMGEGDLALHIHYPRSLSPTEQALILRELGDRVLQKRGRLLTPEFQGAIVLLRPVCGSQPLEYEDFRAAARDFGAESCDGDLPFMSPGQCLPATHFAEENRTDADESAIYITDMPRLRH